MMAGLDDLARMRAQLLAERRQQMQRHPQQVAGAVGKGVDALSQMQNYLARQDAQKSQLAQAAAKADADRRQRAAAAKAANDAARRRKQMELDARAPVRESTVARNQAAAGASEATREKTLAHEDVLRVLGFEAEQTMGQPQDEAWSFSEDELESGEAMPDGDYDLASPIEKVYQAHGARGLAALTQKVNEAKMLGLDTSKLEAEIAKLQAQTATEGTKQDLNRASAKAKARRSRPPSLKSPKPISDAEQWSSAGTSPGGLRGAVNPHANAGARKAALTPEVKNYPFNERSVRVEKYDLALQRLEEGTVKLGKWRVKADEFRKEHLGTQDPDLAELVGLIEELRDTPSRDKSGAVIGEEEQRSLGSIFGQKYIDPTTLKRLLTQARAWVVREDALMRQSAALGGVPVADAPYDPRPWLSGKSTIANPAGAQPSTTPTPSRRMRVPRNRADEMAQRYGWTLLTVEGDHAIMEAGK